MKYIYILLIYKKTRVVVKKLLRKYKLDYEYI